MTLEKALQIIDYSINSTEEEYLEAQKIFWGEVFGVQIYNSDGSYKNLLTLCEEAYNKVGNNKNDNA